MHLAPSTGNCAVSSGPIYVKLVVARSLGQAETIELSDDWGPVWGQCFRGMLRNYYRACMQKYLFCRSLVQTVQLGGRPNSAHNSSHVHVLCIQQRREYSLNLESPGYKTNVIAVRRYFARHRIKEISSQDGSLATLVRKVD